MTEVAITPTEMSRRERKKLQTRQALRTAALRLFAERGFDATTIQDVTEAADVSPRTFFLHFSSKEDVLIGDARESVAAFEQALRARPEGEDAFTGVRGALVGLLALDETPDEEARLQARLMMEAPGLLGRVFEHYAELEDTITRIVSERYGFGDDDGYPRLLAAGAMTCVRLGLLLWHTRGGKGDLTDVVEELIGHLGKGLATP